MPGREESQANHCTYLNRSPAIGITQETYNSCTSPRRSILPPIITPKPPKLPLGDLKLWVYGPFGGEFDEAGTRRLNQFDGIGLWVYDVPRTNTSSFGTGLKNHSSPVYPILPHPSPVRSQPPGQGVPYGSRRGDVARGPDRGHTPRSKLSAATCILACPSSPWAPERQSIELSMFPGFRQR